MPLSALEAVPRARVARLQDIGGLIDKLIDSSEQVEGREAMEHEASLFGENENGEGQPSVFTCPECHGTLFLTEQGDFASFRCRVGHRFSADSLLATESEAFEAALWTALRALEERNDLMRRMAERARHQGQPVIAARFDDRVREGDHNAELLQQVLMSGETTREETG
jgi:two-component system chemotaxis response regulator CheB